MRPRAPRDGAWTRWALCSRYCELAIDIANDRFDRIQVGRHDLGVGYGDLELSLQERDQLRDVGGFNHASVAQRRPFGQREQFRTEQKVVLKEHVDRPMNVGHG